ncbi:MAG: serine/threonine protein kinase [Myxococcales bacterium]|nr:serine/threonine protein kinase [Myxococcales bacterium]
MAIERLQFASLQEEVRFLRGLFSLQRLADEILEDCLERQLGLAAAVDVYLSQCARMIHATEAFVVLRGTQGPVLSRVYGSGRVEVERLSRWEGALVLDERRTAFVTQLELGAVNLGALGFVLPGKFEGGGREVMALVDAVGEMLDSAALSFLALADGRTPLERLDELCDRAAFRPKSRIGKYELLTPLGTGGMAQVMVARTLGPSGVSRLVALKRILPHLAAEQSMVEQFLDEARIGMRLSHPNTVTFYDFGQGAGGGYYVAMELVRGVDFDRLIYAPPGRLEPEVAAGVMVQALSGLHAAHELLGEDGQSLGLVHRDLSPHNLMVGFDGRVKVLDFGVAKARNQKTITLPGIVKGKPLYMSPEQATAERVDRRSDLFSMGLILYEALSGVRAFDKGEDTATMEAIVSEPLARPAGIANPLWEVVEKALAKPPSERFRTAEELAEAMRAVVSPCAESRLARMLADRFPAQLRECERWERMSDEWSKRVERASPLPRAGEG